MNRIHIFNRFFTLFFLISGSIVTAQAAVGSITFTKIPLNKQLVARDLTTNLGTISIEGDTSAYDEIEIKVYRKNILYNTINVPLNYNFDVAHFNTSFTIHSELSNYSFEVYGKTGTSLTLERTVVDIVAGDVYIINGQSNAEAGKFTGSANANISNFIRIYANGVDDGNILINNNKWYIAQGDGWRSSNGNTGQWGLKLARLIVDAEQIPIAMFNGARAGKEVAYFVAPPDYQTSLDSNYSRLYHRLRVNGLEHAVRAVFWSQGENDSFGHTDTSTSEYKDTWTNVKDSWLTDYPNIEKIYIFQTRNGCGIPVEKTMKIKEAQRQLAYEDPNIHIIQTAQLIHHHKNCHFVFTGGYEVFATRVHNLVARDLYGASVNPDIESPMIRGATLVSDNMLIVKTDASSLTINTVAEDFHLDNAGGATITNIQVLNENIVFTLSQHPGANATLSYFAPNADITGNFITNTHHLELICFNKYPIIVNIDPNLKSVIVTPNIASLNINSSLELIANLIPANVGNQNVTWFSNDDSIASVDVNGVVTGISEGTAIITVTTEDGGFTDTATITVANLVTDISISPATSFILLNDTETLTATITPSNASNQNVTWSSSDNTIATVDSNGMVTAISEGIAIITVTSEENALVSKSTTITASNSREVVGHWPLDGHTLDLSGNNHHGVENGSPTYPVAQINEGFDGFGNYSEIVSDPFDFNRGFTLMSWINPSTLAGFTKRYIIEKDRGKTDWYALYIINNKVWFRYKSTRSIKLSNYTLTANTFVHVAVTYDVNIGKAKFYIDGVLVQTTNASALTPSETDGVLRLGINSIGTEEFRGVIDEVKIFGVALTENEIQSEMSTAINIPVTGVSLSLNSTSLSISSSQLLTKTILPNNASNQEVIWSSSDDTIVSVDINGKITANSEGVATITVTTNDGNYTDTATIAVIGNIPVSSVSVSPNNAFLSVNQTQLLLATIFPNNASNQNIRWESDNTTVATVSINGEVTTHSAGKAIIFATTIDGNFIASSTITVTQPDQLVGHWPLDGNTLDFSGNDHHGVEIGSPAYPTAQINKGFDCFGNYSEIASDPFDLNNFTLMSWINPSTLAGFSKRYIIEKDHGKTDWYALYIVNNKVWFRYKNTGRIKLSNYKLTANTFVHVAATYDANIGKVKFYIDGILMQTTNASAITPSETDGVLRLGINSIGTEEFKGIIDEVKIFGVALTENEIQNEMTTAINYAVTGVNILPNSISLAMSSSQLLTATILPNNASNQKVIWSSSDDTIVSVDVTGKITAHSEGIATITVTTNDGNYTDIVVITVTANIPVTSVSVSPDNASLSVGQTQLLVTTIFPNNASNQNVIWESDNTTVATVSTNGEVSSHSAGSTNISAKTIDGNFIASSTITVIPPGNLVGHWPLDGNTLDFSGNNRHGAEHGSPIYPTAQINEGFDGFGNYSEIVSDPFDLNNFTLMSWINPSTLSGFRKRYIIEKDHGKTDWYALYLVNNRILFRYSNTGRIKLSNYKLTANTFVHVAATYDANIRKVKFYINGILMQTTTASAITPSETDGVLRLGINSIETEEFRGIIDEVKIFGSALTESEIFSEYNIGL